MPDTYDTAVVKVIQTHTEGNYSKGKVNDKKPGGCYKDVNINFEFVSSNTTPNQSLYNLLRYYRMSENKEEITATNYLFSNTYAQISFNDSVYTNVFYDSIVDGGVAIAKIYNKADGLLAYRLYEAPTKKLLLYGKAQKTN